VQEKESESKNDRELEDCKTILRDSFCTLKSQTRRMWRQYRLLLKSEQKNTLEDAQFQKTMIFKRLADFLIKVYRQQFIDHPKLVNQLIDYYSYLCNDALRPNKSENEEMIEVIATEFLKEVPVLCNRITFERPQEIEIHPN
jgi:hypothetical protein